MGLARQAGPVHPPVRSPTVSERTRCFVAFTLPEDLVRALGDVQRALRGELSGAEVRWVAVGHLHLTVRFFGDLEEVGIESARQVLRQVGTGLSAIEVQMSEVSAFPLPARPQVIWVGLESRGNALLRTVTQIDSALQGAGFPPPDKPWKSHVTLGRARGRPPRVARGWEGRPRLVRQVFRLTTLTLMKSELRSEGPRYTPLCEVHAA